jgi:hypothetical protein
MEQFDIGIHNAMTSLSHATDAAMGLSFSHAHNRDAIVGDIARIRMWTEKAMASLAEYESGLTTILVCDEHGVALTRCTLAEFIRDNNCLDDGEIGALRTRIAKGEEWHCGGGAAAFFTVSRVD